MKSRIRNFSIIAHIDHGKTTLTDQFLYVTGTIQRRSVKPGDGQQALDRPQERIMDSNPIEQERGITIKLAPVRMNYTYQGQEYILNLIDTPGHVDFGYEVSRSLAAGEGALLVVDATQGIQAQTLSNYEQARKLGLTIIPVLNKIDLPSAEVERVMLEVMELTGCKESDIIQVSAKSGLNVEAVLEAIIQRIPAPGGEEGLASDGQAVVPRALLITSQYDSHKGAVALVRVVDGELTKERMGFSSSTTSFVPLEIGVFSPQMRKTDHLSAGEVGYVATGLKSIKDLKIGDTLTTQRYRDTVVALPGYREPQPMVFMELYPVDSAEFTLMQDAVEKLSLKDAALTFHGTHSQALGSGLRVGFLGILHAEIVLERLEREFGLSLIATAPSVTYKVTLRTGQELRVEAPSQMPDPSEIEHVEEPLTRMTIFTPKEYLGDILTVCRERRGEFVESKQVGERLQVICKLPLAELITDFHDVLKSLSSGYASMEYDVIGYQPADAVKVTVMLNKEPVEALSFITVRENSLREGRRLVDKLKEVLPRQMFELPIQASIGGTVIARETVKAFRKDVTAKLYGGDVTRRKKLLAKQAKGKKRMKQFGRVEIDQETFFAILKRS